MEAFKLVECEVLRGEGLVSYQALNPKNSSTRRLLITVVDMEPRSVQREHSHPESEQMYYIVSGHGEMVVGDETRKVDKDTTIFIPPKTKHYLRNISGSNLRYLSATTPPVDVWRFYQK